MNHGMGKKTKKKSSSYLVLHLRSKATAIDIEAWIPQKITKN